MSHRRAIGTSAWARHTRGRLSAGDRLRLVGQAVALQLAQVPSAMRRRLKLPSRSAPLDLEPLRAPDTPIAQVAERALAATSPAFLVHHGYRSYAWGKILAAQDQRPLDDELFYVACLLHDLGLVSAAEPRPTASCCFGFDGAETARVTLADAGMDGARTDAVAEAICLHLNVRVPLRHGAEAHYLNAATALDVAGIGLRRMPRLLRASVLHVHPRDGFRSAILEALAQEVRTRPGSRIHFLATTLGFQRRVARAWRGDQSRPETPA